MSQPHAELHFRHKASLPIIRQEQIAECGHACIAMISHFLGHKIDLYTLRKMREPSTRGVTLSGINQLCEQLGFKTRALRVPRDALHLIKRPAILHWNLNHFVVLKSIKKNSVIIHDPAYGIRTCSMDEFHQSFSGIVLEVEASPDFKVITSHKKLGLYDLVKTVSGINKLLALLLFLSLSIELLSLFNPLLMQYVTDHVIGSNEVSNLYTIGIGFIIITCLHGFTEYIRGHLVLYITSHLGESFSSNIVRHLLQLPLTFFESRHKGDIQSKYQAINEIQRKVSSDFINTMLDGAMIVINLVVMFMYSRILTSIVLTTLGLYVTIRYLSYQSLKNQTATSIQLHAKVATIFLETLHAMPPIKAFLKESLRFNTWRNSYIDSLNADIRVSKMQISYQVLNQLLFHVELIIVICVGANLVLMHQFSVGMLIAFLAYRVLLVNKSSSFIQQLFDYKLISIQLDRLSDILFQPPEIINTGCGKHELTNGAISLHNISFQYNKSDINTIDTLTMEIQSGEKVAIVGPSGCGKTTLLKIMMGLLIPTSGDVCIDSIPLPEFGIKNYREITASVLQDDVLLSGSIINNIAFFEEEIDKHQVYHVAKIACIHDTIIQLPMGYETLVGDMGSTLSGGQRQRILLARALYKNPKILFLDEATSHLDIENERLINHALKKLRMTQIIIAHRQETIAMADRVIHLTI